jgi:hypothetical protein
MSVQDVIATEVAVQGAQEVVGSQNPTPTASPAAQVEIALAPRQTWICSKCGARIEWLPEAARKLPPQLICCKKCVQKRKEPAHPEPCAAAPQRPRHPHAPPKQEAPMYVTLRDVRDAAMYLRLPPQQIDALLSMLRVRAAPAP